MSVIPKGLINRNATTSNQVEDGTDNGQVKNTTVRKGTCCSRRRLYFAGLVLYIFSAVGVFIPIPIWFFLTISLYVALWCLQKSKRKFKCIRTIKCCMILKGQRDASLLMPMFYFFLFLQRMSLVINRLFDWNAIQNLYCSN